MGHHHHDNRGLLLLIHRWAGTTRMVADSLSFPGTAGERGPRQAVAEHANPAIIVAATAQHAASHHSTAQHNTAHLLSCPDWLLCSPLPAPAVGSMAQIVSKLDSHTTAYNEQLETVSTFLKDVDLPHHLSKRCGTGRGPQRGRGGPQQAGAARRGAARCALQCGKGSTHQWCLDGSRRPSSCLRAGCRVLDFFKGQKVKAYDRQAVITRLPFELRSKIVRRLYEDHIKVRLCLCPPLL